MSVSPNLASVLVFEAIEAAALRPLKNQIAPTASKIDTWGYSGPLSSNLASVLVFEAIEAAALRPLKIKLHLQHPKSIPGGNLGRWQHQKFKLHLQHPKSVLFEK